jgi:flagella basal body P-ring formation protein FlgA
MTRMRTRRAISAGHVVLQGDLEEMPQIMRGQEVAVQVRYGTVAIETTAMAVREARLGETVTLQNPTSHATYLAQVVGQGKASVAE